MAMPNKIKEYRVIPRNAFDQSDPSIYLVQVSSCHAAVMNETERINHREGMRSTEF